MQQDSSRAHSVMSSGKADASTSCLPSQCFDSLTKSCVKCYELYKDNTTEPAHAAPTSTLIPSADQPGRALIFVGLAAVGLLLVLAAICVFLARKVRRQRRKRKQPDEESKAHGAKLSETVTTSADANAREKYQERKKRKKNPVAREERMDSAISSSSPIQQDFTALTADDDFALAKCPHVNGAVKVPRPPGKDTEKQRLCCQGNPVGDVIVLSPVSPCLEECNHCFPLPATELGATALVTTKTTQKTCISEEMA